MEKLALFVGLMRDGGPINGLILALYAAAWAIFSGRLLYFFRSRCSRGRFFKALAGEEPLPNRSSPLCRIVEAFREAEGMSDGARSEKLDREGTLLKAEMERGFGGFSFIGTIAPLLGLLGTITGLMNAFGQIERRGAGVDIAFLSGGIREAMITTATGLVTALCALGAEKLFAALSEARLRDMAVAVSLLEESRAEKRRQDSP
ncbi:MAG: MotA/TolQ/ExbB proton channel family protein [Treponema sp.]|nr:MotA/TolQ/ExbB proton channel family protein [Treponema sp.]